MNESVVGLDQRARSQKIGTQMHARIFICQWQTYGNVKHLEQPDFRKS